MPTSMQGVDPAQNEFLASLEAKSRPEVLKSFVPLYGALVAAIANFTSRFNDGLRILPEA